MMILIAYDVRVIKPEGRKRLRLISKTCMDYGMRVQNSVFECEITPAQWVELKDRLLKIYDEKEDSLRFYQLGSNWKQKVEHYGTKHVPDVIRAPLIV